MVETPGKRKESLLNIFFAKIQNLLKDAIDHSRLSLEGMREESKVAYGQDVYSAEDFADAEEKLQEAVRLEAAFQKTASGVDHLLRLALNSEDETLKTVAKQTLGVFEGKEAVADLQKDALKALAWLTDEIGDPAAPAHPSVDAIQNARDVIDRAGRPATENPSGDSKPELLFATTISDWRELDGSDEDLPEIL